MNLQKRIDIWVQQATHDLTAAKKNFEMKIYDYCLIACEQAVEKILKALYLKMTGNEPPHIHVLEELVNKVELADELGELIVELEDYYFLIRYPGFGDEISYKLCSDEDAKEGLSKAEKILKIVQDKIKSFDLGDEYGQ